MSDIIPLTTVTVDFHGDRLEAITTPDGKVWVVLRRCCEALGIDTDSQRKRLTDPQRSPWACTVIMTVHDVSGRKQEACLIDLDTVPMWLATIDVSRVSEDARPKLLRYQIDCARVLRDHFFGSMKKHRPWVERIGTFIVRFKGALGCAHGDRWAVAVEIMIEMVTIEDEWLQHGVPALISDQPDGSVGKMWVAFREGKSWALPVINDVGIGTPHGFTAYPNLYQYGEHRHFGPWFNGVYLPQHMPAYLDRKAQRDKDRWAAMGLSIRRSERLGSMATMRP